MSSKFSDWSTEELIEHKDFLLRSLNKSKEATLKFWFLVLGAILFLAGIVGILERGINFLNGVFLVIGGRAAYMIYQEYKIYEDLEIRRDEIAEELLKREKNNSIIFKDIDY